MVVAGKGSQTIAFGACPSPETFADSYTVTNASIATNGGFTGTANVASFASVKFTAAARGFGTIKHTSSVTRAGTSILFHARTGNITGFAEITRFTNTLYNTPNRFTLTIFTTVKGTRKGTGFAKTVGKPILFTFARTIALASPMTVAGIAHTTRRFDLQTFRRERRFIGGTKSRTFCTVIVFQTGSGTCIPFPFRKT